MADASLIGAGVAICAAGAIFGGIALKVQRDHRRWCEGKARVKGVVSRLAERRGQGLSEDASGMPTDAAGVVTRVVRFRAANKIEYEIDAPEAPRELGTEVEVAYDPALPSGGRGVERVPKILIPVVLLVLGAILVAIGASRD